MSFNATRNAERQRGAQRSRNERTVGAHWGLAGLCLSWLVSVPLAYAFSVPAVLRIIGVRVLDLIVECGPPAVAAAVMYAAVATLRLALAEQLAIAALGTLSFAGAFVYRLPA